MTFTRFIQKYDLPGAVVLLEGKRKVAPDDAPELIALGRKLTQYSRHMLFRSGNADGSDHYFSQGVASIDRTRLQVITPYTGHRQKTNLAYDSVSLEDLDVAAEELVYQTKSNTRIANLVDQYVAGNRNQFTIKAAYLLRDTVKVIGTDTLSPASFGIFYDDLSQPKSGGTGHTIRICENKNIPWIDQRVWMEWLRTF